MGLPFMFAIKMIVDSFAVCCFFHYTVASVVMYLHDLTVRFRQLNIRVATYYFFVTVGELI